MGWNDPYMTKPVGLGDISQAVNNSSLDLGYLIENGSINKWAAYKPVRSSNPGELSRAEFAAANFGLTPPSTYSTPAATRGSTWPYGRPRGASLSPQEWYRALDFAGYYKDAPAPCEALGNISVALSQSSTYSFGAAIAHSVAGGDSVTWQDLSASVGSYYLCVIFATGGVDLSGNQLGKTSAQTISSNGLVLDITQSELTTLYNNGYKYYYLCAVSSSDSTSQSLSNPSGWGSRSYIALPTPNSTNDVNGNFTITAASIQNIIIKSVSGAQSPTRAIQFLDASSYRGAESFPVSQNDYFKINAVGQMFYIHFGLEITAGSSSFTIGSASVKLSQTFESAGGFSSPRVTTLYDSNFTQQTQVTIPAGTTQVVYLVASAALLSIDSSNREVSGAGNGYFSTTLSVYQNGVQIGSDQIRVRNYDF